MTTRLESWRRNGFVAACAAVAGVWAASLAILPLAVIDDAFISYRYAANLSAHGQLVFNPGEYVEGITNLLWTVLLAPIAAAGLDVPEWSVWIGALFLLAAALRLCSISVALGQSPWTGVLAAWVLLCSADVVLAATNGLEGGLFLYLLAEVLFRYFMGQLALAATFASLLFLTRPEGLVVGLAMCVAARVDGVTWRELTRTMAPLASTVVLTTIARISYFGSPIPNSVVAKSPGLRDVRQQLDTYVTGIIDYIATFASRNPQLLVFALATPVVLLVAWRTRLRGFVLFCAVLVGASWTIMIRNGGDWMPNARLLTQWAVVYIAIALSSAHKTRQVLLGCGLGLALAGSVVAKEDAWNDGFRVDTAANMSFWAEAAHRLREGILTGDPVSAEGLGFIGYALPEAVMHDPLGLTDAHLARHGTLSPTYGRMDVNYTLGTVKPVALVWHYAGHVTTARPDLLANYVAFCAARCDSLEANIVMIRRDRLATFQKSFADWEPFQLK